MSEPFVPTLADEIEIMRGWLRIAKISVHLWDEVKESTAYRDRLRRLEATKATLNRLLSIQPESEP